jgi:hypothetical protein
VAPRPTLVTSGDAHHEESRIAREQYGRREAHLLERAGAIVLDLDLRGFGQAQEHLARGVPAQIEAEALLVARVHQPPQRHAAGFTVPEVVAAPGLLDLDHLRAEVSQHMGQDGAATKRDRLSTRTPSMEQRAFGSNSYRFLIGARRSITFIGSTGFRLPEGESPSAGRQ